MADKWLSPIPKMECYAGSSILMEIYTQSTCTSVQYHGRAIRRLLDTLGISMIRTELMEKSFSNEAKSNLDVRGIVAIALNGSLGTAGVAIILELICLVLEP